MELDDELRQCMRDIRILRDIEQIKRVKHQYFRCIDTANVTDLAEILDEHVTAKLVGGSYVVELAGRDDYLEMVRNGFHADAIAQHNGHHPDIDVISETEATGVWYLHDVFHDLRAMRSTIGTALYRDKYVKVDGRWKIKHTGYERIYEVVEEIKVKPTLTAHYLGRHGHKIP
ncbi:Bile acid 7-alpha dehydratase [Pandoraea terrae]|uniref:Bile acid 7-alpha dehydratase n=1 Tax=Pandoraea terrae TaxID=1537710 RepID=A0A5E4TQJ7_9BURK|nr:nuclear transport factor 2 family protein [Pandoraea terrae]VVD90057.1 Bile acid 7-alpha dehydratase [Pandoraea terrae]